MDVTEGRCLKNKYSYIKKLKEYSFQIIFLLECSISFGYSRRIRVYIRISKETQAFGWYGWWRCGSARRIFSTFHCRGLALSINRNIKLYRNNNDDNQNVLILLYLYYI